MRDSASHIFFRHVYGISHQFQLTAHKTYNEYVYAVRSVRVDEERLLPPEFPLIKLWFSFNIFQYKYHLECPGAGACPTKMTTQFVSREAAVRALSVWKDRFWCEYCEGGLLFPVACRDHPNA